MVVVVLIALLSTLVSPGAAAAQERPMLRLGSSGDAVLVLEQRLDELGFAPGAIDTSFDSSTRSAVVSFQRAAGIGADGIVGPITWSWLDRGVTAPPAPTPTPDPTPSPSPSRPTLRLGSSGDAVLTLEQRLVALGFAPGTVDTSFDSSTRSAVVSFQRAAGIGADGIVGPITWSWLDRGVTAPPAPTPTPDPTPSPSPSRPTLRLGSSGDAVLVLEQRLVELGFTPGTVDTSFDSSTRSAVVSFQRAAGIGADGIVGPITWSWLDRGVTAPPTPAPEPEPAPDDTVRPGDSGPAVRAIQDRLLALGYWLPSANGVYDENTRHAVVAFQKAAGLARDGVVGSRTQAVLDQGYRPSARSSSGTVMEVDKSRQILMVVVDGQVQTIYDSATGKVMGTTPNGTHRITRQIDGYRYAPLGTLYRPKYFYGGVAIHGYPSVPAYPASHGCVRVTYPAMDHIWATGVAPVGTPVMVYG